MTAEEKAKEKVSWNDVKEKYLKFHRMDKFTENMAIDIDFGYWLANEVIKEAMRWRDPVNDPPKCNDLMQIKYGDIFSNIIDYGHDRYLEDMGMWDIEQLANIKVLAWRPIK